MKINKFFKIALLPISIAMITDANATIISNGGVSSGAGGEDVLITAPNDVTLKFNDDNGVQGGFKLVKGWATGDEILFEADQNTLGGTRINTNLVVNGNVTNTANVTTEGETTQNGNVTTTGDVSTTGNMTTTGNVSTTGNVTTTGNVSTTGNLTTSGTTTNNGNVLNNQNVVTNGTTTNNGDVLNEANVVTNGDTTNNGSVTTTGLTTQSNVVTNGTTTQNGNVTTTGNVTTRGNVTTTGLTTHNGNVVTNGTTTQNGNVNTVGNLSVTGNITSSGNIKSQSLETESILLNGVDLRTELNDLNSNIEYAHHRIDQIEKRANRGIAVSLAVQQSVPNVEPGQVGVFGGVGHYEGETATAFGVVGVLPNGRTSLSTAIGFSGKKEIGARVGVAYVFGGK